MDEKTKKEFDNLVKEIGFERAAIKKWSDLGIYGLDFNQLLAIKEALSFWMNPCTRGKIKKFLRTRAFALAYSNEDLLRFLATFPSSEKEKELVEKILWAKSFIEWLNIYKEIGDHFLCYDDAPVSLARRVISEAVRLAENFTDYKNIFEKAKYGKNFDFSNQAASTSFDKMCQFAQTFEEWGYLYSISDNKDPRRNIFLTKMSERAITLDQLIKVRSDAHYHEPSSIRQNAEERIVNAIHTFEECLLAYREIVDKETNENVRRAIEEKLLTLAETPDQLLSVCSVATVKDKDGEVQRITYEKLLNLKEIPQKWIEDFYQGKHKDEAKQILLGLLAKARPCMKQIPEALPSPEAGATPQRE